MIPRDITPIFLELLNQYPVVTLTGPRQSGKTLQIRDFHLINYKHTTKIFEILNESL